MPTKNGTLIVDYANGMDADFLKTYTVFNESPFIKNEVVRSLNRDRGKSADFFGDK